MRTSPLPLASALQTRERRLLQAATALLIGLVATTGVRAVFGVGGQAFQEVIRDWVTSAVYIVVGVIVCWRAVRTTEARRSWMWFAFGISVYGLGNVLWAAWIEHLKNPPIPSICDGMWLTLYPCCYVGVIGLARVRERRVPARIWLDGVIAGLGVTALGAAIVLRPVIASVSGNTAAVVTEMAYPLCDLLLAGLVVGVLALRGWRLDRMWTMLGAGFLALATADCMYALQVAGGASAPSAATNLAYDVGVLLLALAAWQPGATVESDSVPSSAVLGIPAAFTLSALGLLIYDHFSRLDPFALGLALATILAAFARTALAFRDVRALAETRRQALTDDLTSMPNRRHFLRRLSAGITASRASDTSLALLLFDLDRFKELNDTLGHDAGDQLLCQVGERLHTAVRATDMAARLGGDEFGVLLSGPCDAAQAELVADKILAVIGEPFPIKGVNLRVTASIGIALFPEHAANDEQLMQHADVAMYEAKSTQSGRVCYASERDKNSVERLTLAGELSRALECGEIEAHFQPKADASSGKIVGLEALARWRHPERGMVPPDQFIAVAEQAGLGRALTHRMLELALTQVKAWREAGLDLHVAVNTTVADLLDTAFPGEVAATLAELRPAAGGARAGGHREHGAVRPRAHRRRARAARRAGARPVARRLRHRLLLAHAPEVAARGRGQDRSLVRRAHDLRPGRRGDRRGHDPARAQHRQPRRRRGHRGPHDVELARGQPLRARPGLRALAAAARDRAGGAAARRARPHRAGPLARVDRRAHRSARPHEADALASDDGRRDRRGRRAHDPRRLAVARGLRLVQLPGLRSRSRDHRRGARLPGRVGHPPELVAPAGQPRAVRADRGAPDGAAGQPRLARAADDHAHPHVGHPGAGGVGHDLPGLALAQDDLRRLPDGQDARRERQALPLRRPPAPGRAAAGRAHGHATRVHGRRQQHDRQRARPALRSRAWHARTGRSCTSTTRTASA